jgi:uncharacterized membrane protein YfcA
MCKTDADCHIDNVCQDNSCIHKKVFPIDNNDIFGFILIIIGSALSNAGGIGGKFKTKIGGGLYIPILILVLHFYIHEGVPVSKLMTLSGAFISFLMNFRLRHPTRGTISIDYNIALLMVPGLLYGTLFGINLNIVTPSVIILLLMTIVLLFSTIKTFLKSLILNIERKRNSYLKMISSSLAHILQALSLIRFHGIKLA